MIDIELLTQIVSETIAVTTQHISDVATFAKKIARVTLMIAETLEEHLELTQVSRGVGQPEDALIWKCSVTYQERKKRQQLSLHQPTDEPHREEQPR